MPETGAQQPITVWFRATSGMVWSVLVLVGAVVAVVADAVTGFHPEVPVIALFVLAVTYVVMFRPRFGVVGDELVIHQMLSTVRVPLAALTSVLIRQVTVFHLGEVKITSPAVSRSLRSMMRRTGGDLTGGRLESLVPHAGRNTPESSYADLVEERLVELASAAQSEAGVSPRSEEQERLAEQRSTRWAWPEIGVLLVTGVASLVLLLS